MLASFLASVGAQACAAHGALPPAAPAPTVRTTTRGQALLETALALRGTPYRPGGQLPATGFDCSGFVRYVLRQHGIDVPRTVAAQFHAGIPIGRADIQAGDLVFFAITGAEPTHVGIAAEPASKEFIHAPDEGASVRIERFDTKYWDARWLGARRVF